MKTHQHDEESWNDQGKKKEEGMMEQKEKDLCE